ncbi:unnamed protein product [Eruca vesicaria subsp. sativa]|uniref:Uncharacterized protein n=1 Tax=Eruca vesicaria subsp. sativa TaxID=29727 RepID=A0ABC8JRD8_ERUVS|nr:unnamed protein product [Eruca vesicaria subsp. sativa]
MLDREKVINIPESKTHIHSFRFVAMEEGCSDITEDAHRWEGEETGKKNQILLLSLAEVVSDPFPILNAGAPFPILKVKALTLDINISEEFAGNYLKSQGFNVSKCWRSKDGASWNKCCEELKAEQVSSLVELVLKNTEKLTRWSYCWMNVTLILKLKTW